eukprot:Gb_06855 [translate_table: standard]
MMKAKKHVTSGGYNDFMEGGMLTIVTNAEGQQMIPSVVAYTKNEDSLARQIAKQQVVVNPENMFFSVKRFIGRKMSEVDKESKHVSYPVLRIINEPTVTSFWHMDLREKTMRPYVFDLGSGKFDVSILEVGNNVFEVLSTLGDIHLGGDDFDEDCGLEIKCLRDISMWNWTHDNIIGCLTQTVHLSPQLYDAFSTLLSPLNSFPHSSSVVARGGYFPLESREIQFAFGPLERFWSCFALQANEAAVARSSAGSGDQGEGEWRFTGAEEDDGRARSSWGGRRAPHELRRVARRPRGRRMAAGVRTHQGSNGRTQQARARAWG